jgi:hypothetical protein
MLVLETVLSQLHLLFTQGRATTQHSEEFRKARRKLEEMRDAIIASVPQHIGLVSPRENSNPNLTSTPISSVTVRETPSPATSPPSVSSPGSISGRKKTSQSGPTLLDPLKASEDPDEEARRFMLFASSTNTVIWPLYVVGVSSVCAGDMKAYVVERLHAVCAETGDRAAGAVAGMVDENEMASEWMDAPNRPRYNSGKDIPMVKVELVPMDVS